MQLQDEVLPLCPLTGLDTLWLVTRRKPAADLPWFYRKLALWVYAQVGWSSDYSVEYQGVYTDKSEAIKACKGKSGWSWYGIPLNASLPDATCTFRCRDFPAADVHTRRVHQNLALAIVATPQANMTALQNGIAELRRAIAGS